METEFIDLVSDQEEENEVENSVESGNERNEISDELEVHLNNLKAFVERKSVKIRELEQNDSQNLIDKMHLSNEIIKLRKEGKEKDATINELRQQISKYETQPGPSIQSVTGPIKPEDVGGVAIPAVQNANEVQGAVRKERGSVSNLVNWNHPPITGEEKKNIPKIESGPQHASVQATTRPDNHQQRDEAVPKKRISLQPTQSVIEGRMESPSQNLASNAEAVGSRGEDSGSTLHYQVGHGSKPLSSKCVCGKSFKTYKAFYAHLRRYEILEKNRVSAD